jgi:hypothetical protein
MNPTMLEASDDLTNLSHLNEPAGMSGPKKITLSVTDAAAQSYRPYASAILKKRFTHTAVLS